MERIIKRDNLTEEQGSQRLANQKTNEFLIESKYNTIFIYKDLENSDVIIDAIFGTGFKGALNEYN